jgi:NADPH-dependent glutamate synthase beta subunit-like oxidoreductase
MNKCVGEVSGTPDEQGPTGSGSTVATIGAGPASQRDRLLHNLLNELLNRQLH